VCGVVRTEQALAAHGLEPDIVFRHRGPLGPILRARVSQLWADGRLPVGSFDEEIVIVRGRRARGPSSDIPGQPAKCGRISRA
jgi:release factor glutamine methyltransferase